MGDRQIKESYEKEFWELERLLKHHKISPMFYDFLADVLACNMLYEMFGAKIYVTPRYVVNGATIDKITAHLSQMYQNSDMLGLVEQSLCRQLKRYLTICNKTKDKDSVRDQETAKSIAWDEPTYYETQSKEMSFQDKSEFARGNKEKYPYLNGIEPKKMEVDSVPYPIYYWEADGKKRVAGETLLHLFDMPTRPTKRAQFNVIIALCQDHGGHVIGAPFYAECTKFFSGDSNAYRSYNYIHFTAKKMRDANAQLYKSFTGTSFDMPIGTFIEKCAFKITELQRVVDNLK